MLVYICKSVIYFKNNLYLNPTLILLKPYKSPTYSLPILRSMSILSFIESKLETDVSFVSCKS